MLAISCGDKNGTSVKKIDNPFLMVDAEMYADPFIYDGTAKTVHLSEEYASYYSAVEESSTFTATNAGEYIVTVRLVNPKKAIWKDGTKADKTLSWSITPYNPASSSSGYRLTVGSYVGENHDTTLSIDISSLQGNLVLDYEFLYGDTWTKYTHATFTVDSSYAHIENDNELVFTSFDHTITLVVGSDSGNYLFHQSYSITPTINNRVLTFDKNHATASYYGYDEMTIIPYYNGRPVPTPLGLISLSSGADGFRTSGKFKSVDTITVTFVEPEGEFPSFGLEVFLSVNTNYYATTEPIPDVTIYQSVPNTRVVTYDYTSKTFDPDSEYYALFWVSGGSGNVIVESVTINYTL